MMDKLLLEEVTGLIQSHREDDWWDFKQEHHRDKGSLVHDIMCMANNRVSRDSYIIFGVEDKSFRVCGVENDEKRRNQQQIVDVLRKISFAGSVRPRIEIKTIELEEHEIDVLIVKDSTDVPYYLEKEYRDSSIKDNKDKNKKCGKVVRPYHIYTRVVDNNTAIDQQADINDVEFLWRKRFGIDLPVMDRLNILLNDVEKWNPDWGNKKYCYHSIFPEFQIMQLGEMNQGWVPAAAFYAAPDVHIAELNITYHNTIIYESELWSFDGFRKYLPRAQTCTIEANGELDFRYSYYLLNSIEGKLLKIFTNGTIDISSREPNYHQLLIFEDESDKSEFDDYLSEHFQDHTDSEIKQRYKYQIQEDNRENFGGLIYSSFQVAKAAWIYEEWLKNKKQKEKTPG